MNIGSVIYNKDSATGELSAVWNLLKEDKLREGTGVAEGEPGPSFSGIYQIDYFMADGNPAGSYTLEITNEGKSYFLNWFKEYKLQSAGIGKVIESKIIAGWKITE